MELRARQTEDAQVEELLPGYWRLSLSAGGSRGYRWAQLDDYLHRTRRNFLWQPPFQLTLDARVSSPEIQGTWGFGLWNDPFSLSFGTGGTARRLPQLPNAVWFFNASQHNYLSIRDDIPAQGFLMSSFSSPSIPAALLGAAFPFFPILKCPTAARFIRKYLCRVIHMDSCQASLNPLEWHHYRIGVTPESVQFKVDETLKFVTRVVPRDRLGLVFWIDNQFAAFPPDGKLQFGMLPTLNSVWLEIRNIQFESE